MSPSKRVTPRQAMLICLLLWFLALLATLHVVFLYDLTQHSLLGVEPFVVCGIPATSLPTYRVVVVVEGLLLFILPSVIIAVCYCTISRSLLAEQRATTDRAMSERKRERNLSVIRMLVVIVVVFLILTGPQQIYRLYGYVSPGRMVASGREVFLITNLLAYTKTWLHVVVYGLFNEPLRAAMWRLVHCRVCQGCQGCQGRVAHSDPVTMSLNTRVMSVLQQDNIKNMSTVD